MSKRFKGKLCVYCRDRAADGADHVFAREFFLPSQRANLPKVPACEHCNRVKSELEHYAVTVLPFGGQHTSAQENLKQVSKRLARNPPLHSAIAKSMHRTWVDQNGITLPTSAIRVDRGRLEQLFTFVGRGLLWVHFGALLEPNDIVTVHWLFPEAASLFERDFFRPHRDYAVSEVLGGDVVEYQGIQTVDLKSGSVWRIRMYGGLQIAASQSGPEAVARDIGLFTGPSGWGT